MPVSGRARQRCLFLVTPTGEQCGVESFTRLLVSKLQTDYPDDGFGLLAVSKRWRDLPAVLREVARADQIVFSVPMTAWKKLLLLPLAILLFARLTRCQVIACMHEWAALHWLRRLAFAPYVLLSRMIIVVSPLIASQIAGSRWLAGAGKKCRLVPNVADSPAARAECHRAGSSTFAKQRGTATSSSVISARSTKARLRPSCSMSAAICAPTASAR